MLFSSVGGYMLKNTEATIFRSFLWQLYDIITDFDKINSKFRTNKKMLFPSVGGY